MFRACLPKNSSYRQKKGVFCRVKTGVLYDLQIVARFPCTRSIPDKLGSARKDQSKDRAARGPQNPFAEIPTCVSSCVVSSLPILKQHFPVCSNIIWKILQTCCVSQKPVLLEPPPLRRVPLSGFHRCHRPRDGSYRTTLTKCSVCALGGRERFFRIPTP